MQVITSVNNPFIKRIVKLKQKKYRDKEKRFIVEGYNILTCTEDVLECLLITKKEDENLYKNIEHIYVTYEIIKKITDTVTPQGIVGICKEKENKLDLNANCLLLDGLQDPGNIGTLIRTALCFDFKNIILSLDSCDIYNEKIIRATQGALFKVNIIRTDLKECIIFLKENGYNIIGTSLKDASNLENGNYLKKEAIILGNEGNGVKDEILALTDRNVYIPINKEMESLNVAIAGAIAMHWVKYNGTK